MHSQGCPYLAPSNDETLHIVERHIDYILSSTPINDTSMTQIKEATALDPILISIMIHRQSQWPNSIPAADKLCSLWNSSNELMTSGGAVLKGSCIVIPESLRPKMLTALHEGHQSIEKCWAKVHSNIWWLKISLDTPQHVSNCTTYNH